MGRSGNPLRARQRHRRCVRGQAGSDDRALSRPWQPCRTGASRSGGGPASGPEAPRLRWRPAVTVTQRVKSPRGGDRAPPLSFRFQPESAKLPTAAARGRAWARTGRCGGCGCGRRWSRRSRRWRRPHRAMRRARRRAWNRRWCCPIRPNACAVIGASPTAIC
ncbi:hypothetical protein [Lysobacter gummosus]|uniref:hypothetical protein n=1 Tax=Lysobacter gummosus TaxID=262324 RepID=UPI003630BEF8